jgi:SagB-type dehydrogenase family enzyme
MEHPHYKDIIRYHEETKHHLNRYARSAGHLDWNNQPYPFRHYEGSDPFPLSFLNIDPPGEHLDLYRRDHNPIRECNRETLSGFLELSLGLSAWKGVSGSRWSLRINPSSGNLHPTEAHLILPKIDDLYSGVFHYDPYHHSLEPRAKVPKNIWDDVYTLFPKHGFFAALSTIFWRESWKYGERAFRYCNHDIGHALACLSFSANLFGWKVKCMNGVSDQQLAYLLGFDQVEWPENEKEVPEILVYICPFGKREIPDDIPEKVISEFRKLSFCGFPNRLSNSHVKWDIIDDTSFKARKPATPSRAITIDMPDLDDTLKSTLSAAQIIRQRRSGLGFSPEGSISKSCFFSILDKTLHRRTMAPFDADLMPPAIDLSIFVHRVEDIQPGLYLFSRTNRLDPDLKNNCKTDFLWRPVDEKFPLYLLHPGDFRDVARRVSCHQDIAGDSCFSLGMIATFRRSLQVAPWNYRRLFWESGMIGQILYLEAEANGIRGTGIGCYFDDEFHHLLGFRNNDFQSLYHFTVGKPVDDPRLKSFPPYYHLKKKEVR